MSSKYDERARRTRRLLEATKVCDRGRSDGDRRGSARACAHLRLQSCKRQRPGLLPLYIAIAINLLLTIFQKLSQGQTDTATLKKYESAQQELEKLRSQVQQNEATRTENETQIIELKSKVQTLEDEVTSLNVKLAGSSGGSSQAIEELRSLLQKKNEEIKAGQERLQALQQDKDQLQKEHEALKTDEVAREKQLKDLSAQNDKRQDLKGLEETVEKELNSLNALRRLFVKDLAQKLKKAPNDGDEEFLSSPAQKQKIAFLQNNLDQLTRVHKQVRILQAVVFCLCK